MIEDAVFAGVKQIGSYDPQEKFTPFPKVPRLSRLCTITEKIDGTNGAIRVYGDGTVRAASRTRWITPEDDNFGFAAWVRDNAEELRKLGVGLHFGEWYGRGIQRNYGRDDRRFALFNVHRWSDAETRPTCCEIVPVIHEGEFCTQVIDRALHGLAVYGSHLALGFMNPEGIMVYHHAANQYFKKTLEKDGEPKGARS
jgi:hypothetical protein